MTSTQTSEEPEGVFIPSKLRKSIEDAFIHTLCWNCESDFQNPYCEVESQEILMQEMLLLCDEVNKEIEEMKFPKFNRREYLLLKNLSLLQIKSKSKTPDGNKEPHFSYAMYCEQYDMTTLTTTWHIFAIAVSTETGISENGLSVQYNFLNSMGPCFTEFNTRFDYHKYFFKSYDWKDVIFEPVNNIFQFFSLKERHVLRAQLQSFLKHKIRNDLNTTDLETKCIEMSNCKYKQVVNEIIDLCNKLYYDPRNQSIIFGCNNISICVYFPGTEEYPHEIISIKFERMSALEKECYSFSCERGRGLVSTAVPTGDNPEGHTYDDCVVPLLADECMKIISTLLNCFPSDDISSYIHTPQIVVYSRRMNEEQTVQTGNIYEYLIRLCGFQSALTSALFKTMQLGESSSKFVIGSDSRFIIKDCLVYVAAFLNKQNVEYAFVKLFQLAIKETSEHSPMSKHSPAWSWGTCSGMYCKSIFMLEEPNTVQTKDAMEVQTEDAMEVQTEDAMEVQTEDVNEVNQQSVLSKDEFQFVKYDKSSYTRTMLDKYDTRQLHLYDFIDDKLISNIQMDICSSLGFGCGKTYKGNSELHVLVGEIKNYMNNSAITKELQPLNLDTDFKFHEMVYEMGECMKSDNKQEIDMYVFKTRELQHLTRHLFVRFAIESDHKIFQRYNVLLISKIKEGLGKVTKAVDLTSAMQWEGKKRLQKTDNVIQLLQYSILTHRCNEINWESLFTNEDLTKQQWDASFRFQGFIKKSVYRTVKPSDNSASGENDPNSMHVTDDDMVESTNSMHGLGLFDAMPVWN